MLLIFQSTLGGSEKFLLLRGGAQKVCFQSGGGVKKVFNPYFPHLPTIHINNDHSTPSQGKVFDINVVRLYFRIFENLRNCSQEMFSSVSFQRCLPYSAGWLSSNTSVPATWRSVILCCVTIHSVIWRENVLEWYILQFPDSAGRKFCSTRLGFEGRRLDMIARDLVTIFHISMLHNPPLCHVIEHYSAGGNPQSLNFQFPTYEQA